MLQEPVYTRLAKARELLTKVHELSNRFEVIAVLALLRTASLEHVGDQGGVSDFLLSHELNEVAIFGVESHSFKVLDGEASKTVVEQIKFNPFLVQCQVL